MADLPAGRRFLPLLAQVDANAAVLALDLAAAPIPARTPVT
jgi:hypothetical protein